MLGIKEQDDTDLLTEKFRDSGIRCRAILDESGKSPVSIVIARACLKKAFCKMCVTICGIFCPDEGAVVGYGN